MNIKTKNSIYFREKNSPFTPYSPVAPENFQGRESILEYFIIGLNQAAHGKAQHFFLMGDRGFGKSSVANFLKYIAEKKYKMISVHVYNDGVSDIDTLMIEILESLLVQIESEKWSKKIFDLFKDNIQSLDLFGAKFEFKPKD
ncbi:MAG: ATP-binding protein, partial [Methanobrevibacter sp.]|nr:ATP-binding protein [Methanobrevibacter sp.]